LASADLGRLEVKVTSVMDKKHQNRILN